MTRGKIGGVIAFVMALGPILSCASAVRSHRIVPGDSLQKIAKRYDVSPEAIRRMNGIPSHGSLEVGRTIELPKRGYYPPWLESKQYPARIWTEGQKKSEPLTAQISPLGFSWPLATAKVSSAYGKRRSSFHHGVDLIPTSDDRVRSVAAGTVRVSGRKRGYGRVVIVDHPNGYQSIYAHLSERFVKEGQTLERGQLIGRVGRSGNATGVHLHFELRRAENSVNPLRHLPSLPNVEIASVDSAS